MVSFYNASCFDFRKVLCVIFKPFFVIVFTLSFVKTSATTYTFINTTGQNISWTNTSYWDNYPGTTLNTGDNIAINGLCAVNVEIQIYGSASIVRGTYTSLWINPNVHFIVKNGGHLINDAQLVTNTGKIIVENGGTLTNQNALQGNIDINPGGTFNFTGGAYGMTGNTFTGNLTNTGSYIGVQTTVSSISGNFNNGSGTIHFIHDADVNNVHSVGTLSVSGTATLGGTFNFFSTSVVLPPLNAQYTVIQANNRIGTFTNSSVYIRDGKYANMYYTANSAYVKIEATVLSAELIDFTTNYEKSNSVLNWQTASEKNSDHFDIERSTDSKLFIKIGAIKAFGTTNQVQNYSYLDASLPPQYNVFYYRLRQVDKDNKAEYSPIRSISIDKQDKPTIKIYPNPNNGQFVASVPTSDKETDITIQNSHGQVIWKGSIAAGQQSQDILLDQAANGLYFVSCRNSEGYMKTVKFVINR